MQPQSLAEAFRAYRTGAYRTGAKRPGASRPGRAVYFSGGGYLVAEKNPAVHTLIDLRPLLEKGLVISKEEVRIGAGVTLQELVSAVQREAPDSDLTAAIKWSCSSKNIRNQRTLGGELGQHRVNSEIIAWLYAVDAELTVSTTTEKKVNLRDWDRQGIVTEVTYFPGQVQATSIQRMAPLPSAPAVVLVAGIRREEGVDIAIGGRAANIYWFSEAGEQLPDRVIEAHAAEARRGFRADHYGSLEYKGGLIKTLIRRVRDEL